MSKAFDEIMKIVQETGLIPDDKAKAIITEHGALSGDEKKQIAAAIKMKKSLGSDAAVDVGEVSLEDYMQALSVLDSEDASEDDKKKAKDAIEKFES